jgi:ABC-type glycerol-3-phosphate transport system substrate-binding protein
MSKFQIIVLCVFGLFIFAGVGSFAFFKGKSGTQAPPITIWGTLDAGLMSGFIQGVVGTKVVINYDQKPAATFDTILADAIANGNGPDAILISQDQIMQEASKLTLIPYTAIPQSAYESNYIQEAELYMQSNGLVALPFSVDPLVMYWNRDLLSNANIATPPQYWSDLTAEVPALTVEDKAYNIDQSAVGLGEYTNVDNAKQILSAIFLQAGTPIVQQNGNSYQAVLDSTNPDLSGSPTSFYTQFADPTLPAYTWNRSLLDSMNLFISNKLAYYFGFASEDQEIAAKNPNLNFAVALFPQLKPTSPTSTFNKTTYGTMYGFSILRSSPNIATAVSDIYKLTTPQALAEWSDQSGFPSVLRDQLTTPDPTNPASSVFDTSALWARGWDDPDSGATDVIFSQMISAITSGQMGETEALGNAQSQLQNLF